MSDDQQEQQERTVERFYTWPNPDGSSTTEYHYTDGTVEQVTDQPEPGTVSIAPVGTPLSAEDGWTEVGYTSEPVAPAMFAYDAPRVPDLSAALRVSPEAMSGISKAMAGITEALAKFTPNSKTLQALAEIGEAVKRQDADEQTKRERALRLVRNRNTGPAPRGHGRRR